MSLSDNYSHDVLICYRRTDIEFARALSEELKKRFDIDCFRDEESHPAGHPWRRLWPEALSRPPQAALAPHLGPTVVVLATPAAAEQKQGDDIVVKEIWEALNPQAPINEVPIVVLRFGAEGWPILEEKLRTKAAAMGADLDRVRLLNRLHQPRPLNQAWLRASLDEAAWDEICRPIITSVRAYFIRLLSKEREATRVWAKSILARQLVGEADDFAKYQPSRGDAHHAIQKLAAREKRSVVVVGSGGRGKTTQVARSILTAIDSPHGASFFPVVLSGEETDNLDATLARRLGLTWLAHQDSVSLSDEGLAWFRDKLCFITDSLERADNVARTASQLERLRSTATILITTRPEAWAEARRVLAVDREDVHELKEIDIHDVATYLGVDRGGAIERKPYLRNPVFLDIAKYLSRTGVLDLSSGLETETELLDAFKSFSIEPPAGKPPPEVQNLRTLHRSFLSELADRQLEQNRLGIPLDAIAGEEAEESARYLSEERKLAIVNGLGPLRTIRLRHDIIDAHNMADLLRDEPARVPDALQKLRLGFGQVAFEGIVQTAHDRREKDAGAGRLIDAFFSEFLRLVDNKKIASLQAGGWNSGYVISARLHAFEDHIKRVLSGEFLGDDVEPGEPGSPVSAVAPPRLTQLALSSVASMLGGARALEIEDPDGALLGALVEKITIAKNRGRLIEGLAKIKRPDDVVERLGGLAAYEDVIRSDRALARYIAAALADVARASVAHRSRIEAVLDRLAVHFESGRPLASATILRAVELAISEVAALQGKRRRPRPLSVAEVLEGLSNVDPDRPGNFSDWMTVEFYLDELVRSRGLVEERLDDAVILAVGRVLWHQHLRCYERAARTLGAIDHPMARGLLLHALTFESEEGPEREIIEALRRQIGALARSGADRRVRFRLAFMRALAQRERCVGRQRLDELRELLGQLGGDDAPIVTEGFIELKRLASGVPALVLDPEPEPIGVPTWLTVQERNADVGEEWERKIALRLSGAPGERDLPCVRSSWRSPRRLHVALLARYRYVRDMCALGGVPYTPRPTWDVWKDRDSEAFTAHIEAIASMHAAFEDGVELPTFATLHAILVTSDDVVIEAQRSSDSTYLPGIWATSFEEQMLREDIENGHGLATCLLRGIEEETGVGLRTGDVEIAAASVGVEWATGNSGVLVLGKLGLTAAQFRRRMRPEKSDRELSAFSFVPAAVRLQTVQQSELGYCIARGGEDEHPTTSARLALMLTSQRHADRVAAEPATTRPIGLGRLLGCLMRTMRGRRKLRPGGTF